MAEENGFDLGGVEAAFASAGAALEAFARGPARKAADDLSGSFETAAERIAKALGGAAISGEVSFKRLAKVVLEELAKIALQQIVAGAQTQTSGPNASTSLDSFLLGGGASVGGAAPVNVSFHMSGGDSASIQRSSGQIAAQVARAVMLGRRNL